MNKKDAKKAPALRFKGFTNDWEQRKLTDVTYSYSGLTYSPTDVQDKGTFVLRSSNVKNNQLIDADNVYVNPDIVNSNNVKVGDVIVVVRNGSRSLIGKHAIVTKEMPHTVIGAFMSAFRGENGDYINALLSTNNFQKEVHKSLGATINQITGKDFSMMNFLTPKLEEQNKIGSFFKQLDNTIALQQRKLESFQFTYHEIIRRLFLKKAKWQQTKLSDLVTILDKNRKPVKKEDRLLGDTPYYGANGIQDYISGFTHKGEFILIAEDGANSLTEYPIYFVKGQIWVNNHAHVLKVNRDVSPLFLALALKQINYSKYTVGSSRNKLNLKDLENIAIFIPDNNEQQKIGQFYSNYLNYLRINKKRIQYMKQFKQFLLQNMFI